MESLNCPICQEYFKNVVETPCCSHGFCFECLESGLKATNGTCPSCRTRISIFECTPNKLVQRMVDNLPMECIHPNCTAQLTRGIFAEHIEKCPNRPDDSTMCKIHKKPLQFFCLQDEQLVCEWCAFVGKHRQHNCSASDRIGEAVVKIASLSLGLQSNELQANAATLQSIVAHALRDVLGLTIMINAPPSAQTTESEPNTAISKQMKFTVLCAFLCWQNNTLITLDNMQTVAAQAGGTLHPQLASLLHTHRERVSKWFTPFLPEEEKEKQQQRTAVASTTSTASSSIADSEEYEQLKEKYHSEQFNFEGAQVTLIPLCPYVYPGVTNHIYVLLEIRVGKKKEEEQQKRPPLSVSLVLDRSGSMSGVKIERAKDAIVEVIDSLEEGDSLNLVQYDTTAEVVFKDGTYLQKEQLKEAAKKIFANAATNISGGMNLGYQLLQSSKIPTKKMFLFSDGCATNGITSREGMAALVEKYFNEGSVGTSSFGIGADFDEAMMRGIATAGHGYYFFIDDAKKIPKMLDKAFRGLSRTVATGVTLKVAGSKGRIVRKLTGSDDLFKGVSLGDMREKDLKQILLQVEVNETGNEDEEIEIFEYELSYNKLDKNIQDGPIKGSLKLKVSTDINKFNEINGTALVYLKINECAELDKKILKLVEQNKYDDAIALKQEAINILAGVLELDEVGFVKVLLMRSTERLQELITLRDNYKRNAYVNTDLIRKKISKEAAEEEDEDMGFGLFD